jgi:hypothetical protein
MAHVPKDKVENVILALGLKVGVVPMKSKRILESIMLPLGTLPPNTAILMKTMVVSVNLCGMAVSISSRTMMGRYGLVINPPPNYKVALFLDQEVSRQGDQFNQRTLGCSLQSGQAKDGCRNIFLACQQALHRNLRLWTLALFGSGIVVTASKCKPTGESSVVQVTVFPC